MTPAFVASLFWFGMISAAVGAIIYFVQIALHPKWVRAIAGGGLLFSAIGLAEVALSLKALGPASAQAPGAAVGVAALIAAVYLQSAAIVRGRRERAVEAPSAAA